MKRTLTILAGLFLPAFIALGSLRAQSITLSAESFTWEAGQMHYEDFSIDCQQSWTITISYDDSSFEGHFEVDFSSGSGSENLSVVPLDYNTGTVDITATLVARAADGSTASLQLTHRSESAPDPPSPPADPTERLPIPGNWILTRTYTSADGSSFYEDITFYNGLGLSEQIVQVGASAGSNPGRNIVTPVVYDNMLRPEAKTYLPYVSTSSTRTQDSSPLSAQAAWYNANGYSGQGAYAFTENRYEPSPLNRIIREHKPGSTYASASGNRYVSHSYSAVSSSDAVLNLSVRVSDGALLCSGYAQAGSLLKTRTTDEDGAVTIVFSDSEGRTALERRVISGSSYADTYHVYDAAGRLCWVISPEGSALLSQTASWTVPEESDVNTSSAARYCYIYTHDGRGRILTKKLPGKAVEYFVYDKAGRLVMSQDGMQREKGLWTTLKMDAHDRLVEKRLLSSAQGRSYFQSIFSAATTMHPSQVYTSSATLLQSIVYGSYSQASASGLGFSAVSGVTTAPDTQRITGIKTYEKVAILSPSSSSPASVGGYVERAFYYDPEGRLIQTVEKNGMDGSISRSSSKYDFTGNVLASAESHTVSGVTKTISRSYSYDSRGRLLSESCSVNGGATASVSYAYDALGRLQATTLGSGSSAVSKTDSYNIQGWLAESNATRGSTSVFRSALAYYSPSKSGSTARYSGIVSEWSWQQGTLPSSTFSYSYDALQRLLGSSRYEGSSTSATLSYTERDISYDRAGNITALKRYESSAVSPAKTLSYSYEGNRRVGSGYDANGNLTSDASSGVQTSYNILNLPSQQTASGQTIRHSYLADGTRWKSVTSSGSGFTYRGSFEYDGAGTTLRSVGFSEGRIHASTSGALTDVAYHIKDHLGSVRAIVNASGAVTERNDYHPYGARHGNSSLTKTDGNRWRFSGKEEFDDAFGLPQSDFGARFYDRTSWTTIDPLAEKYYSLSPYNYCAGNPIIFVDRDGKRIYFAPKSTEEFKRQFAETVKFMNSRGTAGDLAELERSETVFYIAEAASIMDMTITRRNYILWDPNHIMETTNHLWLSPATGLAHEANHALQYDNESIKGDENQRLEYEKSIIEGSDKEYTNKEDRRVITGIEQEAAIKHGDISKGQVTRYDHKGKQLKGDVSNLTPEEIQSIIQSNNRLWEER